MRDLKNNIYVKIGVIVLLTLLLLIPKVMIENLIHEREYRQTLAINEESAKWGKVQTLAGPIVSIPYYRYIRQKSNKNDSRDTTTNIVRVKEHLHFLPNDLKIDGQVFPEKRYRALYEIVVYNSQVNISGLFKDINFKDFDIPTQNILFDKAFISIGISDLRGIEKQIDLNWNNDKLSFNPGTVTKDVVRSGINARIPLKVSNNSLYSF